MVYSQIGLSLNAMELDILSLSPLFVIARLTCVVNINTKVIDIKDQCWTLSFQLSFISWTLAFVLFIYTNFHKLFHPTSLLHNLLSYFMYSLCYIHYLTRNTTVSINKWLIAMNYGLNYPFKNRISSLS